MHNMITCEKRINERSLSSMTVPGARTRTGREGDGAWPINPGFGIGMA